MGSSYKKVGKNATVKIDTTLLDALIKGTEQRIVVRVGVLGSSNSRNQVTRAPNETAKAFKIRVMEFLKSRTLKNDDKTNAEIGLVHEKGSKSGHIPRRSWLEEPLADHLSLHFAKAGKNAIERMLKSEYKKAYADLGVIAEVIIQKGFETGGYGKWQALSPVTIARKGSSAILIDTAQLRRSVTSEVVSK